MRDTPRVAGDSTHDTFGIVVLASALMSLLLLPQLLGPLAIAFGAVAVHRKERFGPLALTIGLVSVVLVVYQILRAMIAF